MRKKILIVIADILAVIIAYGLALLLRFDMRYSKIPKLYIEGYLYYIVLASVLLVCCYVIAKLYRSVWSYAGINEILKTCVASIVACVLTGVVFSIAIMRMPISFYLIGWILVFGFTASIRMMYRLLRRMRIKADNSKGNTERQNIMIIGAGAAGLVLLREYRNSYYLTDKVKIFIDDNAQKWNKYLDGVLIEGGRDKILESVEKYRINKIILAMPSADRKDIRDILEICKETDCQIQTVPGVYQLVNGEVNVSKLRNVEIEDLLGRDPIEVNLDEILGYIKGKNVLVTGGGGSIGSEICTQLAEHEVGHLIIFDIYENNAYDIQQKLRWNHPELNLTVLIGSVRNTHRINGVMKKYKPDVVFHAAAHKHVPLMEDSPNEAIKNNVFGTYKTASAAGRNHVKKFVLISTDKAVNPTNIMGASKRMCEMIVQTLNHFYETDFVAVRFGNVLGSNGSVIPLFKKQIAAGGPVTVTHPDIIRYFMTIPEAVSLVLQAGAYAKGGEIFVLDMGEPVKIADLAKNMIRLSGYKLGEDIEIEYTGLRPGEKLYEELLMDEEGLQDTENKMIHIGKPIDMDEEKFMHQLIKLRDAANDDSDAIRAMVKEIVPTYQMPKEKED
ncbi:MULTISPECIES: nucleoside-diphosphate sugar epimerase/dehydratase [Clostridia]|uniref:nucleoside-diphosphate sugar epimerase/dehydratase n=1 Tax=Clostridia TaxID=186801 RepID=UPI000E52724C|nr:MULTISPECIES: nucleoside-diphosphate sugar epimerase/dehydratase [Clostridia]RHV68819.1 polysaccharide biosynthesis protein [Roseburia sp. OM02-15]